MAKGPAGSTLKLFLVDAYRVQIKITEIYKGHVSELYAYAGVACGEKASCVGAGSVTA